MVLFIKGAYKKKTKKIALCFHECVAIIEMSNLSIWSQSGKKNVFKVRCGQC